MEDENVIETQTAEPIEAVQPNETILSDTGKKIAEQSGEIWTHLATVAIEAKELSDNVGTQVSRAQTLKESSEVLHQRSEEISSVAETTNEAAHQASETAQRSKDSVEASFEHVRVLVDQATSMSEKFDDLVTALEKVSVVSQSIKGITSQTQLLALNATIEAARAGEAGKGFAVVAGEVKSLARETERSTIEISSTIEELSEIITDLKSRSDNSAESAIAVREDSQNISDSMESLLTVFDDMKSHISVINDSSHQSRETSASVMEEVSGLSQDIEKEGSALEIVNSEIANLLSLSESTVEMIVEDGYEIADTPYIKMIQKGAAEIAGLFERAVEKGDITLGDLFDVNYQPIPGSNPQQMMTKKTAFTDKFLPDIQEAILTEGGDTVLFCAAVDVNGYLPTHNKMYSSAQGSDPEWNAAHCRNRRVFDDPVGLGAGQNTKPFIIRTYKRDMGGGTTILMKDGSAPIYVNGRHWGGLRMGYRS